MQPPRFLVHYEIWFCIPVRCNKTQMHIQRLVDSIDIDVKQSKDGDCCLWCLQWLVAAARDGARSQRWLFGDEVHCLEDIFLWIELDSSWYSRCTVMGKCSPLVQRILRLQAEAKKAQNLCYLQETRCHLITIMSSTKQGSRIAAAVPSLEAGIWHIFSNHRCNSICTLISWVCCYH
jgi:hypothetical protein